MAKKPVPPPRPYGMDENGEPRKTMKPPPPPAPPPKRSAVSPELERLLAKLLDRLV